MVSNLAAPREGFAAASPLGAAVELTETRMAELIEFRRDLHTHPELARQEQRTTARIAERLAAAGLRPRRLPGGTGLTCDLGDESGAVAGHGYTGRLALRADIDALPIQETPGSPSAPSTTGSRTRAGTTSTPPSSSARAWPSPRPPAAAWRCRRCGSSSSPPRRSCPAAPST